MQTANKAELFNIEAFKNNVIKHKNTAKKILGVDFGTKKLGLSISDCSFQIAFPHKTLIGNWNNVENLVFVLCKIIDDNNIIGIVMGFPLKPDMTQHNNCKIILALVEQLDKIYQNNKYILLVDERFSTKYVDQTINNGKKNTKKPKFKSSYDDDKVATALLNDILSMLDNK